MGRPHRRGGSSPDSTSSDSALRRIRVARWSSWKRSDSASGSRSRCSSSAISDSWRFSSDWFRRARFTSRSDIACRWRASAWAAAISAALRSAISWLLRACAVSVLFQNTTTPTQPASTETPWMVAHSHGRFCPA